MISECMRCKSPGHFYQHYYYYYYYYYYHHHHHHHRYSGWLGAGRLDFMLDREMFRVSKALDLTHLSIQWVPGLKWTGREAYQSPCSATVKNPKELYLHAPCLHGLLIT